MLRPEIIHEPGNTRLTYKYNERFSPFKRRMTNAERQKKWRDKNKAVAGPLYDQIKIAQLQIVAIRKQIKDLRKKIASIRKQ